MLSLRTYRFSSTQHQIQTPSPQSDISLMTTLSHGHGKHQNTHLTQFPDNKQGHNIQITFICLYIIKNKSNYITKLLQPTYKQKL